MERNREGGRRAGAAATAMATAFHPVSRRSQVKDAPADDKDRLEELTDTCGDYRVWERTKKERLVVSDPGNKRKHPLFLQEPQALSHQGINADESVEDSDAEASEDDDEPPSLPPCRKARSHAKEYEYVKDIPAVPRKARSSMSSSSRFSSKSRRQIEPHSTDILQHKAPVVIKRLLGGMSSFSTPQKQGKKLKPLGPKVRTMKPPKVSEPSLISDQEVEVAEALFVLARSVPSYSGLLEMKSEVEVETESRTSSPLASRYSGPSYGLHPAGNAVNGYVSSHGKDATSPFVEVPKRKHPCVVVKQEDGGVSTQGFLVASAAVSPSASASVLIQPSVVEAELDHLAEPAAGISGVALPKVDVSTKVFMSASSQGHGGDRKLETLHSESSEQDEFKPLQQGVQSKSEVQEKSVKLASDMLAEGANMDCDGLIESASRPVDKSSEDDRGISMPSIDLMASPMKHLASDDGVLTLLGKPVVEDSASMKSAGYNADAPAQKKPKDGVKAAEVDKGSLKPKGKPNEEEPDLKQVMEFDDQQEERLAIQEGFKDKEAESAISFQSRYQKEDPVNGVALSFTSTTLSTAASSKPPVVAGWMGGLPPLGYHGPGATPWPAGPPIPTPSLDVKRANSSMQFPHGAILTPVPRMKRCATHVYAAHLILQEQQLSHHSLWSAALCRAAPYNLNIPPTGTLDNDKHGGNFIDTIQKASAQQSGPSFAYAIPQASGSETTVGGAAMGVVSAPNQSSAVTGFVDGGASTGSGAGSGNVMAAQAQQYLATMMQQNGFGSFPFPFNGPPTQVAQFFNSPFFAPYLMLSLPHLQPTSNVLPMQKQHQLLPQSSSSQSVQPHQQLQLQLAHQSSSLFQQQRQSQQLNHGGIPALHCDKLSEKESIAGSESLSTTESQLTAMQQTNCGSDPSCLPNLNMNPSSLVFTTTNIPAMPSPHEQDVFSSGVKQPGSAQQQFQDLGPASSKQQQLFRTQSARPGPISNGPLVGLGSTGLLSVDPLMGAQFQNSKSSIQQQQSFVGYSQQFPRSMMKSLPLGGDYPEDKKLPLKQTGAPPFVSRGNMEILSSLQGPPISGEGPSSAQLSGNGGSLDVQTCRQALLGQGPLVQSQPMKQAVGHTKLASGTSLAPPPASPSVATYADRVLAGNGKFPGAVLPFSEQVAPTSKAAKPSLDRVVKAGLRMSSGPTQQPISASAMSKGQVQQGRGNQAGVLPTTVRMLPPISIPMLSAGTIPGSTSDSQSGPKGPVVSASKSSSNGKGAMPVVKRGPPTKKLSVGGPAISAAVSAGQNMSDRPPATQQKNQSAVHTTQFSQQQSAITANQQRVVAKSQVYSQLQPQQGQYKQRCQQQSPYRPQLFVQQHQQPYGQPPPAPQQQQQQAVPQHTLPSIPHQYPPPNSPQNAQYVPAQQSQLPSHLWSDSHLQQSLQSAAPPQTSAANVGTSLSLPNFTLGTAISGNTSTSPSPDRAARSNAPKAVYTMGSSLLSTGLPEIVTSAHPNGLHGASSPYLQLASIKLTEQNTLLDGVDVNNLPSSSQAAFASNPTLT